MVGAAGGVDPNWIVATATAVGAGLGAFRWYRTSSTRRRQRQAEYRYLWQTVFGKPALVDENRVEYEAAEQGMVQRVEQLEGAFYGHIDHPPHPGRRRSD